MQAQAPSTGARGQADRVRRLERLLDAGRALLSELDLEAVLSQVLDTALELTGARYAALGVLNHERTGLERFLTRGVDDETRKRIGELPTGRGVLGVLISDPRPLRLKSVGDHPQSYGFPLEHPPMSSFLGVPIVIREQPWGNLYLADAAGGEFDEADEADVRVLADWAAIAIANAGAYTSVQGSRDELALAVDRLAATSEIARALAGETELVRVLELIVKRARALTSARGAVVLLVESGSTLRLAASAGDVGDARVGESFPLEQTVAGHVLASGEPERMTDAASRLQFALAQPTGARSGLFVPMLFRGRGVGVLEVFDRLVDGPVFSAADERLLQAFAASAAAAVATAQAVEAQALSRSVEAQEAERARWARELHDETMQDLGAVKLLLGGVVRRQLPESGGDELLARAGELIDQTIAGLRHMITDLRPAQLDAFGLAAALDALAERARVLYGVKVEVRSELAHEQGAGERLPPTIETTVYRIVQEAMTNALKHGRPTRIAVHVTELADTVELSVSDDGVGFDRSERIGGFGLLGMQERAALAAGTLAIESTPGEGTTVSATLSSGREAPPIAASG